MAHSIPCLAVIRGGVVFCTGERIKASVYILARSGKDATTRPESESLSEEEEEDDEDSIKVDENECVPSEGLVGLGEWPR